MPARLHALLCRFSGRSVQTRAWSLLLALVMLALSPAGRDGSPAHDPWDEPEAGYEVGGAGREEPRGQEVLVEQRSISVARPALPVPAAKALGHAAVARRVATPLRLARPYIPHPSRFTERRLI